MWALTCSLSCVVVSLIGKRAYCDTPQEHDAVASAGTPPKDTQPLLSSGANVDYDTTVEATTEVDEEGDSDGGIIALPVVLYGPETSLLFGAAAMYYLPSADSDGRNRVSKLSAAVLYTLRNQFLVDFRPDIFFDDGNYHLYGKYRYAFFPDEFYGVGNDTQTSDEELYTTRTIRAHTGFERRVVENLYRGLIYEFERDTLLDITAGRQLSAGDIVGTAGGYVSGVGVTATFDSRNNTLSPTEGGYYNLTFAGYDPAIGSDYGFTRTSLDVRHFFSMTYLMPFLPDAMADHVLAVRGFFEVQTGEPAFQMMPILGGNRFLRGYYGGRFRDRNLLAGQLEYRLPLFWRFRAAVFGGAGQVSRNLDGLAMDEFHFSGGGGLRFLVDRDAGAAIRFDVGVAEDSMGFYFNVGEAF